MDAVEAAQKRTAERDAMNTARRARLLVPELEPIMPVENYNAGGGDGPAAVDNRTPAEKYRDAVKVNKYAGAIPVFGTAISLLNDKLIQDYEAQNPSDILSGQRYSTIGRLLGFGDPGSTGISGVFGQNSDLYDAGLYDLGGGDFGYRGDAYRAESGGGMGPSYSGPSYQSVEAAAGTYGERDEDGNVSATTF